MTLRGFFSDRLPPFSIPLIADPSFLKEFLFPYVSASILRFSAFLPETGEDFFKKRLLFLFPFNLEALSTHPP